MNDRPDWNSWILQKNVESKVEELKKSDYVSLEKAKIIAGPGHAKPAGTTLANLPSPDVGKRPKSVGGGSAPNYKVKYSPKHSKPGEYHTYTLHHNGKRVGMLHHDKHGDIGGGMMPGHQQHHDAATLAVEHHIKKFPKPVGSMAKADGEEQED